MPSGLHRPDSMSKADQGHDIYSVVRNPHAYGPSKSNHIKPLNTDRIESSAERKHREQMESMKLGYMKIMGEDGSAIKLVTVAAKYLFMAAVLPPYVLLYVVPEFIFVKMLPKLFKETIKMLERLPDWFSNTATFLPNPNQILSQLIKPFAVAKQNLQDFLKMMKHASQKARQAISDVISKGLELAKLPFIRTGQVLKDVGNGLKTLAEKFGKEAIKINERIENAIQAAKDNIAAMVIPLVQPIVQWIEPKYTYATDMVKKGAEMVSSTAYRTVAKVKEKLLPPIEKAISIAQESAKWISNKLYQAAQPLITWAQPKIEKAQRMAKRAAKEIEKVKEKAQQTLEAVKQQVAAFAAPIVVQAQNLINLMVTGPINRLTKKAKEARTYRDRAKQFNQGFKKAVAFVKNKAVAKVKKAMGYAGLLIYKALSRIKLYLLDLPRKIWNLMVIFGKASVKFAKGFVAFSIKSYQNFRLLLSFGMQLIRELKADIGLYIRHARSGTRS